MRYYQLSLAQSLRLAVEREPGVLLDLTALEPRLCSFLDLAQASHLSGLALDELAERLLLRGGPPRYTLAEVEGATRQGRGEVRLLCPLRPLEVWAAGVTYRRSEEERRRESQAPDIYSLVYRAPRPELFFKATAGRVVGPWEDVGVRADSSWNVPEPELAFVLFADRIVGYTIGNDVSSRSIEGENPLYLPQAKVYARSCALGPCIASPAAVGDPQALAITLEVQRGGETVFRGETSTRQMVRSCQEIADWLLRHNPVPDGTVVLTGTGIIPPPQFTLLPGDITRITIQGIGSLENGTRVV